MNDGPGPTVPKLDAVLCLICLLCLAGCESQSMTIQYEWKNPRVHEMTENWFYAWKQDDGAHTLRFGGCYTLAETNERMGEGCPKHCLDVKVMDYRDEPVLSLAEASPRVVVTQAEGVETFRGPETPDCGRSIIKVIDNIRTNDRNLLVPGEFLARMTNADIDSGDFEGLIRLNTYIAAHDGLTSSPWRILQASFAYKGFSVEDGAVPSEAELWGSP